MAPGAAKRRTNRFALNFSTASSACRRWPSIGILLARTTDEESAEATETTGIWALDTLGEDETIARLATGIKRFKLPDEQNFIKLYQQVVEDVADAERRLRVCSAIRSLAEIFQDRRQYPRAAEYWRMAIERIEGDDAQRVSAAGSIRSSATGASSKA